MLRQLDPRDPGDWVALSRLPQDAHDYGYCGADCRFCEAVDVPDDSELPGMWERADLIGGETDME